MVNRKTIGYISSVFTLVTTAVVFLLDPFRKAFGIEVSQEMYLIGVAVFVLGCFMGYLLFSKPGKPSIRGLQNRTGGGWKRYSIVIADDIFKDPDYYKFYSDRLSNFNVVLMYSVEAARQLIGFDVIVLDILGVTPSLKSGSSIAKELYQLCPEKYLMVISKNPKEVDDLSKFYDDGIKKMEGSDDKAINEALADSLSLKFPEIFEELDNPRTRWSKINSKLRRNKDFNRIETVKNTFYYSILGNPAYTKAPAKTDDDSNE